jgi:putative ABC transport system substrate-binding protein
MPRIGFLGRSGVIEDVRQGLREHGYEDGRNIHLEYRFLDPSQNRQHSELAAELVDLQLDVIVTTGSPASRAAKQATSTIPIVVAAVSDPVGSGLVASLARPGGNVTGVSTLGDGTDMKRMERLKEMVPTASRVGILTGAPGTGPRLTNFEAAARVLGQQVRLLPARTADDLAGAFTAAVDWGADALLVPSDTLTLSYPTRVVELAAQHRLPTLYEHREFTNLGGLVTYGPNYAKIYQRAAAYVDKILKGAKPADLPVEQPTTFDFVINLKTAQGLGLTIPQAVLQQATELIQ